jgi:mono/diheme cytochrome c family protein
VILSLRRHVFTLSLLASAAACGGRAPAGESSSASAGGAATAAAPAPEPKTAADIFPPGNGRDLVLANCASCHNVACSAIGARPAARWAALKESHSETFASRPAELDLMFAYLAANFDDRKPEPKVPAAFLEGGCTPF